MRIFKWIPIILYEMLKTLYDYRKENLYPLDMISPVWWVVAILFFVPLSWVFVAGALKINVFLGFFVFFGTFGVSLFLGAWIHDESEKNSRLAMTDPKYREGIPFALYEAACLGFLVGSFWGFLSWLI